MLNVTVAYAVQIANLGLVSANTYFIAQDRRRLAPAPDVEGWFRGPASGALEAQVMSSSLRDRELFDYKFIARLFDEHRRGARDWSFHLWTLLNLTLWYERWIARRV